jgi:addiction module RelE/StbE family toxin
MKIVWTPEALNKLIEIEDFTAQDNPQGVAEFVDHLIERSELIKKNERMGRIVPEISNESIRELLIKNYRLVYRIQKSVIIILTVFEGHRLVRRDEIIKSK